MSERKRKNRGKARIRKGMRQSSTYGEKHQSDNHLEDRISQLPEGILVHILSLLTIKEAGRSSVLSHKWRDLWKFTAGLNFDASDKQFFGKQFRRQRSKFVTWVNQVLKLHQRPSLDEFRVSFRFDVSASHDIDEWMKFWITKRVKRLEFDFPAQCYTLSQECYRCFKCPSNLSSIKCLTSLSLAGVNVDGELIEYCLSNCPHLEQLCICSSEQPVNLKVAGPSLQLKHLEILHCNGLESLEVCAPRLVTLEYLGEQIRLRIGNLPLLAELKVGWGPSHRPSDSLVPFFGCFSHIETLELKIPMMDLNAEILQVPELTNLKRLILEIFVDFGASLLSFTRLIEAAPSLLKFTLKLNAHSNMRGIPLAKNFTNHPHRCLKDVEMFGFAGRRSDLELVLYLLQNAINLEKIVIDPYWQNLPISLHDTKEIEEARKSAHRLGEKVPLGVKLFVL